MWTLNPNSAFFSTPQIITQRDSEENPGHLALPNQIPAKNHPQISRNFHYFRYFPFSFKNIVLKFEFDSCY